VAVCIQEGLTDDDYDMYYEIWQQFDPNGTQYIKYAQLSDFLDVLEAPLQIHKPNKFKIVSMDIPICKGDLCYCVDVLDALTKDFFARKGNPVEETAELGEVTAQADRPGYEPISSTLWRQREEYCARMIQSAWRRQVRLLAAGDHSTVAAVRRHNGCGSSSSGMLATRRRASNAGRENGGGDAGSVAAQQALVVLESER
jgi:voltage-gated sodium channel type II alpha